MKISKNKFTECAEVGVERIGTVATTNICEECRGHIFAYTQKQRTSSIAHVLSSVNLLTIWEGIQARVSDMIEFLSPSGELLLFTDLFLGPIESSRTILQLHMRIVLGFSNERLIEKWDETRSYSTE